MFRALAFSMLPMVLLLAACNSNQPAPPDYSQITAINSFGANPNPAPANVAVNFSWSVTGANLTCQLDVDNNATVDYTIENCSTSSRASHAYGKQGSFTAQLTVTSADGKTVQRTTPVVLGIENRAPQVLSFTGRQGSKENNLIFAWVVTDSDSDILRCRLDADGNGTWDFDQLCSQAQPSSQVRGLATSSSQVEISLPTGKYLSIFEVSDAYTITRVTRDFRAPYNRLPQIHSFNTVAGDKLRGTVSFQIADADGDDVTCSLTVESIGQFIFKRCSTITRSYTFPSEGTYQVKLEVIDEYQGVASKIGAIRFQDSPPGQVQLAAGSLYTCGLINGVAYCWGKNDKGQLGIGNTTDQISPQAVSMPSGITFTSLAAGNSHICGLTAAGAAYCWGKNDYGQLGIGNTSNQTTPQLISGHTFTQLSGGENHTCGVTEAGAGYCWGRGINGQLGLDFDTGDKTTPQLISGHTFTQLAAGQYHTCGLSTAGAAYCFGYNGSGQLGIGNNQDQTSPQAVTMPGSVTFTQIAIGNEHNCGISSAGVAYCWGNNSSGQLGIGNTSSKTTPQTVSMPTGVTFTSLAAGYSHMCGLTAAGAAYCWGNNSGGQLGIGNTTNQTSPQLISSYTFTQLAGGDSHACGSTAAGAAYCWGLNSNGQLGLGNTNNQTSPQLVGGFDP